MLLLALIRCIQVFRWSLLQCAGSAPYIKAIGQFFVQYKRRPLNNRLPNFAIIEVIQYIKIDLVVSVTKIHASLVLKDKSKFEGQIVYGVYRPMNVWTLPLDLGLQLRV